MIDKILNSKDIFSGSFIASEKIEICQKQLCSCGAAPMPVSYTHFLQKINGVYGDGLSLFGVEVSEPFENILAKNTLAGIVNKKLIFLGDSLIEYLCYDWQMKSYIIIDKKTNRTVTSTPLLGSALGVFLREYL